MNNFYCIHPTKKGLIFLIFSCILYIYSMMPGIAQVEQACGTERIDSLAAISQPYYSNNQFLINLADSVENASCNNCRTIQGGIATEIFVIPVKIWIYRTNEGTGGISNERAERLLNLMNQRLRSNGVRIRLYISSEIVRVNNTDFYQNISCRSGCGGRSSNQLFDNNRIVGALNIHIIRTNQDGFGGRARFPWNTNRYSFAVVTDFANGGLLEDDQMVGTMVHELGHTLGLTHTHESARSSIASNNGRAGNCYQESVSRTRTQGFGCFTYLGVRKCEVNGDMLCDTDADPELFWRSATDNNVNNVSCAYIGGGTDNWGDVWTPPTTNYMSYSFWRCRTSLTQMQRGVMYFYSRYYMTSFLPTRTLVANPIAFSKNEYVDFYENDNFWPNAAAIGPAENQYRALHSRGLPGGDVDWVRFLVDRTDTYTIETISASTQVNPDTFIDLYNVNTDGTLSNTPLASDDDSGNGFYSKIVRSLAPGSYALRVKGYSASVTGPYILKVVPQSYVEPPPGLSVSISGPTDVSSCRAASWTANASGGTGTYTYRWYIVESGQLVGTGNPYYDYPHFYARNDEYRIRVEVISGNTTANSQLRIFSAGCQNTFYQIYPNPASTEFEVIAMEDININESNQAAVNTDSNSYSTADLSLRSTDKQFLKEIKHEFIIKLYDKYNQLILNGTTKEGKVKLKVNHLPTGLYFLRIEDKNVITQKRVLINR